MKQFDAMLIFFFLRNEKKYKEGKNYAMRKTKAQY